jgi:hypothetical protein
VGANMKIADTAMNRLMNSQASGFFMARLVPIPNDTRSPHGLGDE